MVEGADMSCARRVCVVFGAPPPVGQLLNMPINEGR